MLRGVCLHMASRGYVVSAVARSPLGLADLVMEGAAGRVVQLVVDYRDQDLFARALRSAVSSYGAFSLAVCWVHEDAPHAMDQVAEVIDDGHPGRRLIHVVGCERHDPVEDVQTTRLRQEHPGLAIRRVVLGFVVEDGRSRWLTHDEISTGVQRAIDCRAEEAAVGVVRPWELRP